MIKCVFHKENLDPIEKHILSFSRPACRGILTWWNFKGLAEIANLTIDKNENGSECHILFGLMYVFLIMFMFFIFRFGIIKMFKIIINMKEIFF